MAETVELVGQERKERGTGVSRRMRRKGQIPAVVYGHKEATLSLTLDKEALVKALRHGARVVDLKAGGKVEKALIREVQFDHLGKDILHVDFARVAADERVVVTVRLEIRGVAPGVTAGGILDQPMHDLSVECLALSMPESIRVNVGEMQIGSVIHVRELTLPPGVKAMVDPDLVVVQVKAKVEEEAAPTTAIPGTETAEPEIIGRKAAAEEEEEEKK